MMNTLVTSPIVKEEFLCSEWASPEHHEWAQAQAQKRVEQFAAEMVAADGRAFKQFELIGEITTGEDWQRGMKKYRVQRVLALEVADLAQVGELVCSDALPLSQTDALRVPFMLNGFEIREFRALKFGDVSLWERVK